MSFNSSQRWSSAQSPLINVTTDGWTWFFRSSTFDLISPPSFSVCSKTLSSLTLKQKSLMFAISIETFLFCRKTSQRHRQLSSKIYASSLRTETRSTSSFCFYVWLFFPSLASDFISFLQLLNLIVKLDVLQISQPVLSSLSAWAASQINRRKWVIRCDY